MSNCNILINLQSEAESAEILRIKRHTLAVWRTRRFGPKFVKIGSKVYYRLEDLEEWIQSRVRN